MTDKLTPDAPAPALSLPLVGGGTWTLSEQNPQAFSMIVVYRGYHCPVCKSYLGKLESLASAYEDAGVSLVAVSMDGEERAALAKEEWGLAKTPVAYGLTEDIAHEWGLYISSSIKEAESDIFAEPGLFWVRPDGRLYLVDIANMPFARPDLDLLLDKAPMVEKGYPARGIKSD